MWNELAARIDRIMWQQLAMHSVLVYVYAAPRLFQRVEIVTQLISLFCCLPIANRRLGDFLFLLKNCVISHFFILNLLVLSKLDYIVTSGPCNTVWKDERASQGNLLSSNAFHCFSWTVRCQQCKPQFDLEHFRHQPSRRPAHAFLQVDRTWSPISSR